MSTLPGRAFFAGVTVKSPFSSGSDAVQPFGSVGANVLPFGRSWVWSTFVPTPGLPCAGW